MDPLVSVVVPIYNGERYLRETLESILAQTYRHIEIIAVDDGSSDSSSMIAESFGPVVRLVRTAQQGHPAARNNGIRASRGEYLAFLDHDDLWAPDKLELQLKSMREDAARDLVFGHIQNFFSPDLDPDIRARLVVPLQPLPGLLQGAMLARRDSFFRVGLFYEGRGTGDFLEWYGRAMALQLKTEMLPQVLVRRRIHSSNYTRLHSHERQGYVRALKETLDRRRAAASGIVSV